MVGSGNFLVIFCKFAVDLYPTSVGAASIEGFCVIVTGVQFGAILKGKNRDK